MYLSAAVLNGLSKEALRFLVRERRLSLYGLAVVAPVLAANIALFDVTDGLLGRPLPYGAPEELVSFQERDERTQQVFGSVAYPVVEVASQWVGAKNVSAFWSLGSPLVLRAGSATVEVPVAQADSRLFSVLNVPLSAGRMFTLAEIHSGDRIAVVSEGIWRAHLDSNPGGRGVLHATDGPVYVVGVFPSSFVFPSFVGQQPGIVVPFRVVGPVAPQGRAMLIGRLGDRRAEAVADLVNRSMEAVGSSAGLEIRIAPLQGALFELHRPVLHLLRLAGGLVLLAAAMNLGGLFLAGNEARLRGFKTKLMLGAPTQALAAQVLIEVLLTVVAAGTVAAFVVLSTRAVLIGSLPSEALQVMAGSAGFGTRTVGFAVLSVGAVAFAAWAASAVTLLQSARNWVLNVHSVAGPSLKRGYALMLALQIGVSAAVASATLTLAVSLWNRTPIQLGYDPSGTLSVSVRLPAARYPSGAERSAYLERALAAIRDTPGVRAAGSSAALPLLGAGPDAALPDDSALPGAAMYLATPGFFAAAGIRIEGREFLEADRAPEPRVAIINRRFADAVFGSEGKLGRYISLGGTFGNVEIVGISNDLRPTFDRDSRPTVFVPHAPSRGPSGRIIALAPAGTHAGIRSALYRMEPDAAVTVAPLAADVARVLAYPRFQTLVFTTIAGLTILLAGAGTYGLAMRTFAVRRAELALRISLGAPSRGLRWLIIRSSVPACTLGIILAVVGHQWIETQLVTIRGDQIPIPPWAALVAALLTAAVYLSANVVAAKAVTDVDPVSLLRA